MVYGLVRCNRGDVGYRWTFLIFVALPLAICEILLWRVLGTHYGGMPIDAARLITLLGLAISFLRFERILVLGFYFVLSHGQRKTSAPSEFTSDLRRRAF